MCMSEGGTCISLHTMGCSRFRRSIHRNSLTATHYLLRCRLFRYGYKYPLTTVLALKWISLFCLFFAFRACIHALIIHLFTHFNNLCMSKEVSVSIAAATSSAMSCLIGRMYGAKSVMLGSFKRSLWNCHRMSAMARTVLSWLITYPLYCIACIAIVGWHAFR